MKNNHVVIMAGGVGSRFWPLSTPEYPKQFIDILGCGRTLIQLTVDRFKGIAPMSNFWVVTNAAYVDIVKRQIPDMPASHILARNTAPCIAWACWSIKKEDSQANVVVTPADAVVMNPEEFRRVIKNALTFTEGNNAIVTIGIKPSRPETGYGYVEAIPHSARFQGLLKDNAGSSEIQAVASFKEKPDLETAEKYHLSQKVVDKFVGLMQARSRSDNPNVLTEESVGTYWNYVMAVRLNNGNQK